MLHDQAWRDSGLALRADLLFAKALLWLIGIGRDATPLPSTHWFFYDRYHRLGEHYRLQGSTHRAAQLERRATEHLRALGQSPDDDTPIAAAVAMPRRRRTIRVDAIGRVTRGQFGSERKNVDRLVPS